MTTTTTKQAAEWLANVRADGFTVHVKPGQVTIVKQFTPGDRDAFVACDGDGPHHLAAVPCTQSGSMWGTDGGSVGGMIAIDTGVYRLNQSGVSKRFTTALARLIDLTAATTTMKETR